MFPSRPSVVVTIAALALVLGLGFSVPTVAQPPLPLFVEDFEAGDLCGWSSVAPKRLRIDEVTPARGAVGTTITIRGAGLADGIPTVRISGGVPWGSSRVELELLSQSDEEILARVGSPLAPGAYDVIVRNCHTYEVVAEAFELSLPFGISAAPLFVGEGDVVVLTGSAFGTTPGALVLIDADGTELVPAISAWDDNQVTLLIPSGFQRNGALDLRVTTLLGSRSVPDLLVMTGVDDGDDVGPRIVSAVATSNTEVVVQFSEAVQGGSDGAENPTHYRVTAPVRTPTVNVLEAGFGGTSFSTVRLRTMSQTDLEYTLAVTNIRDLAGNEMEPPDILVDPSKTTFVGVPPGGDSIVDSDGDGLSDAGEQSGWTVTVTRTDGSTSVTHVTSDPGDPRLPVDHPINVAARDTDGDGVVDPEEKHAASNPRSGDTDGDTLSDNMEWNIILSDPVNQDTDGDGAPDGFEYFNARTSPVLADTDGDQILDLDEILGSNRNPRIADLPRAAIEVGDVRLQIDERFTYQDTFGETVTVESSSNSTLARSQDDSFSRSDTDVYGVVISNEFQAGAENDNQRGKGFFQWTGSAQFNYSNTSQVTRESSISSQQAYQRSLSKTQDFNTTNTVTREVVGARIDLDLTLLNAGDLAFTISDIEVTVLQPSPVTTGGLVPVATLLPNSTLITGDSASFSLGPFTPERGPILFSSRDVFPNLVEQLMKSPTGLLFKVANFTMTDELGRSWTFANQIARDRTAGIIIDVGEEEPQTYLVATALQRDADSVAGGEYVGGFDASTEPLGIPVDFALQDILKLNKNSTVVDGIVAGANKRADSIAQGDDIQLVPPGTTGVGVGTIVVAAGENGVLDSPTLGDDEADITTGYETSRVCSATSDNAGALCSEDSTCTGATGSCTGPEILVRFGSHRLGDFGREWAILTSREIPASADFGQVLLKPGEDLVFAFVQDLDDDGVFARQEFVHGSVDSTADEFDNAAFGETFDENDPTVQGADGEFDSKDTDRDGLGDFAEIRVGWTISTEDGGLRDVRSSPRLRDTDGDGLLDPVEMDLRRYCGDTAGFVEYRFDALCAFENATGVGVAQADAVAIIAGPNGENDSIIAGNTDDILLVGGGVFVGRYTQVITAGADGILQSFAGGDDQYVSADFLDAIPPATDPALGDTDDDGIGDLDELEGFEVGKSIRDGSDGLSQTIKSGDDVQRARLDNPVRPGSIIILPGPNGEIDTTVLGGDDVLDPGRDVKTDPLRRDSDSDLVDDGRELDLGGDPSDSSDGQDFRDSDQDGLTDFEESELGWQVFAKGVLQTVKSSPSLPDSDLDGLPDLVERDLRSNPNDPDTDGDGIRDYDEFADFGRYLGLEQQYPRFFIDGTASRRFGTSLVSADTDLDTLTDFQELIEGYPLLLAGEQEFRQIYTNPLAADSDFDLFPDLAEWRYTDASDPDTDDDGRTDGQEVSVGSDPLVPDLAVKIEVQRVIASKVTGDGGNNHAEMTWYFTTKAPGDLSPVLLTSPHRALPGQIDQNGDGIISLDGEQKHWVWGGLPQPLTCQWYWMGTGSTSNLTVVNSSRTIVLREGQSFALNGIIGEIDEVSADCGRAPNYIPSTLRDNEDGCVATFNEVFSFNDFAGGTSGELLKAEVENVCELELQYSIEVQ